jgi:hypothetical protein
MIEIAIGYVGAYLARKALGVLDHAGADVDRAVDDKLGKLYDWVKAKLTGKPTGEVLLNLLAEQPEGDNQQKLVSGQLTEAIGGDETAHQQLQALLDEIEQVRPQGVSIHGLATAQDVYGRQVGVDIAGVVPEGEVSGAAHAIVLHSGGENVGVRIGPAPGTGPGPARPPGPAGTS